MTKCLIKLPVLILLPTKTRSSGSPKAALSVCLRGGRLCQCPLHPHSHVQNQHKWRLAARKCSYVLVLVSYEVPHPVPPQGLAIIVGVLAGHPRSYQNHPQKQWLHLRCSCAPYKQAHLLSLDHMPQKHMTTVTLPMCPLQASPPVEPCLRAQITMRL